MKPTPQELSLNQDGDLVIRWHDGATRVYKVTALRDSCTCASCREQRSTPATVGGLLPVLAPEDFGLKIVAMRPVGNYAYGITFSDGHDTGIYTLEHLYEFGAQP